MSEHTNERTETHACDSISRQKAIDTVKKMRAVCDTDSLEDYEALLETAFEALPSAQPETEERTAELVQNVSDGDLISRKAAIDAIEHITSSMSVCVNTDECHGMKRMQRQAVIELANLPSAQPEQRWIPFKTRPLTEEEKEEHLGWDDILDCKLPDDGQRILVAIRIRGHEEVQEDEFYSDDGCYLDSGYEIGKEAVAWMPLPKPYAERREE